MGVYFHVYAGPVLVCKYHMAETVEKQTTIHNYTLCSNPNCKYNNHNNQLSKTTKFCLECGSKVVAHSEEKVKETRKRMKSVDNIYDMLSEGGFREDLFEECWGGTNCEKLMDDHDIYEVGGEKFDKAIGRETRIEDLREFNLHWLGDIDTKAECAKCEEFYAKELAYLRTKYDKVTVEWAIVSNGR